MKFFYDFIEKGGNFFFSLDLIALGSMAKSRKLEVFVNSFEILVSKVVIY